MQTICGKLNVSFPDIETALAQYRHKIFIERLGWPLPVENGLERDQFDHQNTFYVITREPDGAICGCARLLPTTEPYLLSEVFPHLLAGMPAPNAHDIWELSRFSAAPIDAASSIDLALNTRTLLAAAVKSAMELGAKRLITVSPLGIERLLHRMGVHAHRAGPPALADGKPIFACWIEIDDMTCTALGIEQEPQHGNSRHTSIPPYAEYPQSSLEHTISAVPSATLHATGGASTRCLSC